MNDKILRKLLFGNTCNLPDTIYPNNYEIGMRVDKIKIDSFMSEQGIIYNLLDRIKKLEKKIKEVK